MFSIIFSTTHAPLSWLIRTAENGDASHCSIGLDVFGVPMVVQSSIGGVTMMSRDRWNTSHIFVSEFQIKRDESIMMPNVKFAMDTLGEHYDYGGLIGYLFVLPARWMGKKISNPLASPDAMVCTEFVDKFDIDGTLFPQLKGTSSDTLLPKQIEDICRADGVNFELLK